MESRLTIENVTNGLMTLQKLKNLYKPGSRTEDNHGESYMLPDKLSLLQETLTSIREFLPETRNSRLSEAFKQGSQYSNVYRSLKQHVREMNRSKMDGTQALQFVKQVAPILSSRQKLYVDKFVKIFDILLS